MNFIYLTNESQLEAALTKQMTEFLLELDKGFAFVRRQKEIEKYLNIHMALKEPNLVKLRASALG